MAAADTSGGALPPDGSSSPARRGLTALALVALAVSAVLGSNLFGLRAQLFGVETPEARPAAGSRSVVDQPEAARPAAPAEAEETLLRSQPWWQGVTTAEGEGSRVLDPLTVGPDAIQWRVNATCEGSSISLRVEGAAKPLATGDCGAPVVGYGTQAGEVQLSVDSDGPWALQVEQQIDLPLVEPPLPAMTAPGATTVATGDFYRLDQREAGTVTIYQLADGSHALRLDEFFVTPNIDLEIHLSPLEAPQSTAEFMAAPSVEVAPLDVTAGSMNFTVPAEIDPAAYGSVVIWCPLIDSAYAAATLVPPA
jgi:hypothetical protein